MTSGLDDLERRAGRSGGARITVTVMLCRLAGKSLAVTDGEREEHQDPRTGEIVEREKWVFLPRSQCSWSPPDATPGTVVELTLPEWLAKEKGLI